MADTVVRMFNKLHKTFNRANDKMNPIRVYHWAREHLIQAVSKNGLKFGAELGVREGYSAELWCKYNKELKLLCIDPWDFWEGHRDMDRHRHNPTQFLEEAKQRLSGYDCDFIRTKSGDYASQVKDGSLDFVYIDGDHGFDGTMLDLILWVPKVRIGGLIAGHAYKVHRYTGVIDAVNVYTKNHLVKEWYITNEMDATYFWQKGIY